jgi:hypothetical protein
LYLSPLDLDPEEEREKVLPAVSISIITDLSFLSFSNCSRWNTCVSFNHTFGMCEKYVVLVEQPYVGNAARFIAQGLIRNEPYSHWLEWKPEFTNRYIPPWT